MFVPSNLLKDLIRFWFEQEESRFFSVSMEDQRNFVLLSCAGTDGLDFLEASLLAGLLKTGNRFFVPCLGLANSHLDRFRYLGAEIFLLKLHGTNGNGDLGTDLVLDLLGALSGGLMGLKLGLLCTLAVLPRIPSKSTQMLNTVLRSFAIFSL